MPASNVLDILGVIIAVAVLLFLAVAFTYLVAPQFLDRRLRGLGLHRGIGVLTAANVFRALGKLGGFMVLLGALFRWQQHSQKLQLISTILREKLTIASQNSKCAVRAPTQNVLEMTASQKMAKINASNLLRHTKNVSEKLDSTFKQHYVFLHFSWRIPYFSTRGPNVIHSALTFSHYF